MASSEVRWNTADGYSEQLDKIWRTVMWMNVFHKIMKYELSLKLTDRTVGWVKFSLIQIRKIR